MRRAGILLHPTSLPGPGPCGDLGEGALCFLDWLQEGGCTLWQVLPLVPTGGGFSPYDSPGAFALGTHLTSLEDLVAEGLLEASELEGQPSSPHRVDVEAVRTWKAPLVARAAARFAQAHPKLVEAFAQENPWVRDQALFEELCAAWPGRGWWDFPVALRDRQAQALATAVLDHAPGIAARIAAQLLVRRQWDALRGAAHERGITIVGDLPIFVSGTGCDTWVHRSAFRWARGEDGSWLPDPVSGVPPDYFAPMGQCWGNPLYAWDEHRRTGFAWWTARFRQTFALVDAVRVDHFRGFCAAWEIPAGSEATEGEWRPGPGKELFDAVSAELGELPIVAEDLGHITPDVEALRDELGVPGMKILQFAFGATPQHAFLPHSWTHPRWVVYTGTHDNDTAIGWYRSTDEGARHRFRSTVARDGSEPGWDLLRLAWFSVAQWAVAPMQDVLSLGSEARMNTPGLAEGNWTWRVPHLPLAPARRLRDLGWYSGRVEP